jgi:hypothetical protein
VNVAPGATFESVAQFATGLATVGVRIRDNQGADFLSRTTSGVVEDIAGSGIYRKSNLVAPSTRGQYTIVWDNGAGSPVYSIEELVVTSTVATGDTGTLYASRDELKSAMTVTESFEDDEIDLALSSASRGMDAATGRRYWLDADNTSVRYYTTTSGRRAMIDDVVDVVAVAIDRPGTGLFSEAWTIGSQYILEPFNALEDGKPYESIRVIDASGWMFAPGIEKGIRVTGQFGWPAVPDQIKFGTMVLAQKLLLRMRQAPLGFQAFPGETASAVVRIAQNDPQLAPIIAEFQRGVPFL